MSDYKNSIQTGIKIYREQACTIIQLQRPIIYVQMSDNWTLPPTPKRDGNVLREDLQ